MKWFSDIGEINSFYFSLRKVGVNSAPDWFLCRFPALSLRDPSSGGVPRAPGESGLHLLHRRVRPRTLPPASCPHSGRHTGSGRKAVPHSLQSAEALRSRAGSGPWVHEPEPLPGSAAPVPAALPAGFAAVCPAAGADDEPAAAVSHQTGPAGRDREESASPPRTATGQVTKQLPVSTSVLTLKRQPSTDRLCVLVCVVHLLIYSNLYKNRLTSSGDK